MGENEINKEEAIGFHKGAIATLAKERQELLKMVSIVEQLITVHLKSLKELGVDIEKTLKSGENEKKEGQNKPQKKDSNLDSLI